MGEVLRIGRYTNLRTFAFLPLLDYSITGVFDIKTRQSTRAVKKLDSHSPMSDHIPQLIFYVMGLRAYG